MLASNQKNVKIMHIEHQHWTYPMSKNYQTSPLSLHITQHPLMKSGREKKVVALKLDQSVYFSCGIIIEFMHTIIWYLCIRLMGRTKCSLSFTKEMHLKAWHCKQVAGLSHLHSFIFEHQIRIRCHTWASITLNIQHD